MTAGFRSRGTRSGFCGVYRRARSQRHKAFGWKVTPNWSAITAASRPAVHVSVANPNAVGDSSSQRATTFSWARVSLAGRPGTGRAANPPFAGSLDAEKTAKSLQQIAKTKKTELLFPALFLRLLTPGGRSAVIVPDGVLFGSTKAHKELRRILVE